MSKYFTTPFPFHNIITRSEHKRKAELKNKIRNLNVIDSEKGLTETEKKRKQADEAALAKLEKESLITKLDLEESIRSNIRSLVLMRIGEFAFDRSLGFEMWDFDKEVFYHEKEPYYEDKNIKKGLLENQNARKHFKENLKDLISENEIRLKVGQCTFSFEKVDDNLSVYQRKIMIKIEGNIKSTGEMLSPPFEMSILYTPFTVESN